MTALGGTLPSDLYELQSGQLRAVRMSARGAERVWVCSLLVLRPLACMGSTRGARVRHVTAARAGHARDGAEGHVLDT
eukprot:1139275-Rhodomonas_salina.2